jgi:hypothetical protein
LPDGVLSVADENGELVAIAEEITAVTNDED